MVFYEAELLTQWSTKNPCWYILQSHGGTKVMVGTYPQNGPGPLSQRSHEMDTTWKGVPGEAKKNLGENYDLRTENGKPNVG